MQSPFQSYLEKLHGELAGNHAGELANYIPELSKANPDWFGVCIVTMDGEVYSVGDSNEPFTIQSIAKAFVYATALTDSGKERVGSKVGVEPSGDAFNSISLDPVTHAPFNPMINAGAIATTSLVSGADANAQWSRIVQSLETFVGHKLVMDEEVYQSESDTGHRNRAIAWMLKNFEIIDDDPMVALDNYFRQCSLLVTCRDLAFMAATLANGGMHPLTKERAMPQEQVERVLSVMATCGMYNYAGSWLSEVGMPAKSGVGGGIVAVLPGRFGIGVFSPRLDLKGNSVRGIEVCKRLSKDFGLNIFSAGNSSGMALGRVFTGTEAPSRRQPPVELRALLNQQSHHIKFLCLHGFLAVDGIELVIRKMLSLASTSHSFILDMHRVEGISMAAARLLDQARTNFAQAGIAVVFSRIQNRPPIHIPMRRAVEKGDRGFLSFEDNDLAAEWCENRILSENERSSIRAGQLADASLFKGLPAELLKEVEAACTKKDYVKGTQILASGQPSDGLIYFIESGETSILVPLGNGSYQRISTLGAGMVFGEMVLLGQTTRSASVFADTNVTCWTFHASAFERISSREPQLKITILENLARDMAEKLRANAQLISALA